MKTQKLFQILNVSMIIGFLIFLHSCKIDQSSIYSLQKYKVYDNAAVSTAHPVASAIAVKILKEGGNAIDAAIAAQFALAVCYPVAGNIGGGGFMIYREQNGRLHSLDYRETAPARSSESMYLDAAGNVIKDLSTKGHLAVGIPGSVDGMYEAFKKFSKLQDWKQLVQPAIDIAEKGFKLTKKQAKNLNDKKEVFQEVNQHQNPFNSPNRYRAGDVFIQKDLAHTLTLIRDEGRAGFYEGENAQRLAQEMQKHQGIIGTDDLKNYQSVWRDVISFPYKNYTIHSMPPPSSGGILLAQLMQSIEPYPIKSWGFQDVRSIHLMTEAEKRAYADRAIHLGDGDFYPVPVEDLINPHYVTERMRDFNISKASDLESIQAGQFDESEETTHFSIVDSYGNAVSITTTLNGGYGSKVVVEGAGYLLNNEMDDFSAKVGVPNMYGLVGAEANKIEPGKRMLSSMTPTIVEKEGKLFMVLGTPGGSTIITSVFQTILNVIEFEMPVGKAVEAPRFHHQWKPEDLFYENGAFAADKVKSLEKMGHQVSSRSSIGRVELIVAQNGKLEAAADTRGDDHVDGF